MSRIKQILFYLVTVVSLNIFRIEMFDFINFLTQDELKDMLIAAMVGINFYYVLRIFRKLTKDSNSSNVEDVSNTESKSSNTKDAAVQTEGAESFNQNNLTSYSSVDSLSSYSDFSEDTLSPDFRDPYLYDSDLENDLDFVLPLINF